MTLRTKEGRAEIRALLGKATERPWQRHGDFRILGARDELIADTLYASEPALIVAAVNALPTLLDIADERDALKEEVERLRAVERDFARSQRWRADSDYCPRCCSYCGAPICGNCGYDFEDRPAP